MPPLSLHPQSLPPTLPVFPLSGVLLLPRGRLPLNIFESRYLAMIDDALRADRLIGMIQPREPGLDRRRAPELYAIGCAGRIVEFAETPDGRYVVTLQGISRFRIQAELSGLRGYRLVAADWAPFAADLEEGAAEGLSRTAFLSLLRRYLTRQGLQADWQAVESTETERLVATIAMVCPLEPGEKQALLEAEGLETRLALLSAMLEMALSGGPPGSEALRH